VPKPDRASPGFNIPDRTLKLILVKATAPIGNGRKIKPMMVATNMANNFHAAGFTPSGTGANQIAAPTPRAIRAAQNFLIHYLSSLLIKGG